MKGKVFVLVISSSMGLVWSIIYLILSLMHDMTEMFNNEFIFLIANIFNIKIATTISGFIFSFIDGALAGLIIGIFLMQLKRRFIDDSASERTNKI